MVKTYSAKKLSKMKAGKIKTNPTYALRSQTAENQ